jgi:hypothetical protein
VTALRLVDAVAGDDDAAAAAALRGWAAARGAAVLPQLAAAIEAFDAVPRFWKKR